MNVYVISPKRDGTVQVLWVDAATRLNAVAFSDRAAAEHWIKLRRRMGQFASV